MIVASLLTSAPALAQQAGRGAANPAVTGVIKSFDGKALVLDTKDGIVTTTVTSTTRITTNVPKKLTDIKPGDFIASGGTRGPDGKLRANEIRIFPAPAGEGQFPMAQPGQTMTNATVTQVMTNATVQQVGGSGNPDPSMLKVGTKVTVNTANAPDGTISAARISISQ
jgi:hypothetical protein